VNGVTNTLVYPLQSLQQNLATIMGAAGYEVAYKGKWHLSLPVQLGAPGTFEPPPPTWSEQDIEHLARNRRGFQRLGHAASSFL
jgi:arylsulfatase A-like enzyme